MTEKITLLIIEDEKDTCDLVRSSLSGDLYNIILNNDGDSAVDALDDSRPDLIILDVLSPGFDDFEICRRIRQIETGKHIPLIFMTTQDDTESINQAYEAGVTDFINKPFNPLLLDYKIQFLLKARRSAAELNDTKSQLTSAHTSRKKSEDKVKTLAYYNKVTGLPNRTLLKRLLEKYITNNTDSLQPVAVLTLTLDRFKLVTDSYGHAFGENLIRKIAIRLIRSIKNSNYFSRENYESILQENIRDKLLTIAHCDGDEFVVVLPEISEVDTTALIARDISIALAEPYIVSGQEIRVTASLGISVFPVDGKNTDTLLKNSATALYHAKRQGGDGYKFFTAKMNDRAFERLTLETSLRKAIDERQFVLYYQPKVSLLNQEIVGMEALLRWDHPDHGLISPEKFINIVEKTGLIIPLGERIIESVCQQIKQWDEDGYLPLPVAINLSPVQLKQKSFNLHFSRILKKYDVKPEMIELEITESTLMNNMEQTITMLKKLRLPGTQVSLDDFGTGYSSLTYLKHFPVNTLKIDRSFIKNVTADSDDAVIVKGVIALAHGMRLKVVAEGIEEDAQLAFLQNADCDFGQGYYFSKPIDVATFTNLFMKKLNQRTISAEQNEVG